MTEVRIHGRGDQGVFAGGDIVPSERTATVDIRHGKKTARYIDAYLQGGKYYSTAKPSQVTIDRMET